MTSPRAPTIAVFDSGLGGLTVFSPMAAALPEARLVYVADEAGFPYGGRSEQDLLARVEAVIGAVIDRFRPDLVVVACNTASTLVLPQLRARFAVPFVGTVPAIKPAAALSKTRCFAILATEGTARRDYTHALIAQFAHDCQVIIHSPPALAPRAEAWLRGEGLDEQALLADIAPCFASVDGRQTDAIVLGCTHYPLLLEAMTRLAPWPVTWIDPAPAIARRVMHLLGSRADAQMRAGPNLFVSTGPVELTEGLHHALQAYGLADQAIMPLELD
jgi:glutamate racemase